MEERNNLPQLPKGWAWTIVGEVAQLLRGVSYDKQEASKEPRENFIPVLRANNIQGELNFDDLVYVPLARVKEEQFIKAHDILIAMSSGSKDLVGKAAQAKQDFFGGFGTFCGLVRSSSDIEKRFIGYFFQSPSYRQEVSRLSSGVNINNLRREHVEAMPFPLVPLPEQHRIVAKIEELFSDLDAGVAALRKTQAELKRYRQAVLKAAVEGKLTAEWRAANAGKVESADKLLERIRAERAKNGKGAEARGSKGEVNAAELPALPEGWCWTTWEGISPRVTVGFVGPMKSEYVEIGIPFLRSQNVRENRFDPQGLCYISDAFHKKISKSILHPGDLAVVRSGSVGVTCVIPETLTEANCADLVVIQKPWYLEPRFGSYYMNSTSTKRIVRQGQVGVALIHFNTKSVAAMPVPLPPLAEQQQIVAEVERRLSVADAVEKAVDASLKQAERLRQSILKRAFAGKLVPQDPSDEPAERLLERIRVDREKQGDTKVRDGKWKRKV